MNKYDKSSCYGQDMQDCKNTTSNSLTNDSFNDPKDKARKRKKCKQSTPVDCQKNQTFDCK